MFEIKSYAEGQMLDRKTAQTLTKPEAIANLSARLSAERAINRHLRQKVSNQRRQLRRLQVLYNAYLTGHRDGELLGATGKSPGLARLEKAVGDYRSAGIASEVPTPTSGLMEQGRKMEASA